METVTKKMPWLDKSLEPKKRVELLVEHMNIDQKIQQLTQLSMKKLFSTVTKNGFSWLQESLLRSKLNNRYHYHN